MRESLRKSGIDIIGDVPWGTHFCQFYQTKEDLADILVPYFKAGLENNEFCLWITAQPLEVEDAKEALRKAVSNLDIYLEKGQIEIIPYSYWYVKENIFDFGSVLTEWIEKLKTALDTGYDGLRFSGNISRLEKEGWDRFVEYNEQIDNVIDNCRIIALCTYSLSESEATEIIDVVINHQFALIKRDGEWVQIKSSRRKKMEKAFFQAIEDWEQTFDAVPDLIAIIDNKYRIVRANRAMTARLGIRPEDCAGLTCYRAVHGTSEPPPFCPHRQLLKDGLEHTAEVYEDYLGGYFLVSVSPLHDPEGKLIGSVHVARDISERKQEEHRIRRYNHILEGINWIFSNVVQTKTEEELGNTCLTVALEVTGSQFGFINKMGADGLLHDIAKSELGWEQCLMYDKTGHRRPPSDFIIHGLYGSIIINEKSFFTNDPQSHPDSIGVPCGHPPLTSFLGVPLVQDGKTVGVIAVANRKGGYTSEQQEDLEAIVPAVTQALQRKKEEQEREQAEKALLESDERFRSVLENSLDSAYRINLQNKRFDYMSPVIERITGFSVKDIDVTSSNGLLDRIHPDDRPRVTVEITRSLEEGFGAHEYRFKCKDGKYRWLADHFSIIKDKTGMACFRAGIVRDITERKKAEEALRLSNIYNRSLIEASLDPLVTIGPDGKITDVNVSTEAVTGRSRDELIGTDFSDYFTEPEKAKEGYQRAFKEGLVRDYPLEIWNKDGYVTPVLYNASVYKDGAGEIIGVFAAARDISELKMAEEKIRTLANAVESSDDAIITKSLDGIITSWNKGAEKVYGYLAEEVLGKNISMLEPDDFKGQIKYFSEKIKHGEKIQYYETLRLKKDGTKINVAVTLSPVFDTSGKLVSVSTIARDITEQKKAEEALRLSNIYNRSLIEASLDPLVTIGPDGKITDVNGATELVTGYSRDELIGTDFSDYFTEPEKARTGYQQVFIDGEVRDYPLEIQHKDGSITPVLYNASVYKDEAGKVIGIFAAARDITERKKAEEAVKKTHDNLEKLVKERTAELEKAYESLKESETGLAEAQKMAHIGNWNWNIATDKAHWSDELYRIFGLNPQEIVPDQKELFKYIHPDDLERVDKIFKEGLKGKQTAIDIRIILANGEERTIHVQTETIFDEDNIPIQVKGITQDITERIKSEKALEKIDKIRIKEIHHRIKNNLQVISSLLDLQAERFQNKEVLEAFRESQNRITSMSLIHEELYKGEGNDTLDFSVYLQKLAESLFQTYSLKSKNVCLLMNLEKNTLFDMDVAVPLGIIVNELVSNSLKHAFTEKEEGEVRIRLCREKKSYEMHKSVFSLTISDNGKGMPESIKLESLESLGLQLVNILVDQLEGKIELRRTHGTEFRITFNVTERS
ncbi:PAS domain S-box protein [Methanosarcina sp.]|uniref:PAS domain S-box protein n=1 Tax=Methanosarcina sp. TaxID=2213 RepID=UPI003C748B94